MTQTEIIEVVQGRTGKRGSNVLNFTLELLLVLQGLCRLKKWDWRRTIADIPVVAAAIEYDLSGPCPNLESIECVHFVNASGDVSRVDPVLSIMDQGIMASNSEQGPAPNRYFREGINVFKVRIAPAVQSDSAAGAKLRVTYWSMPQSLSGTTIPVVPAYMHDAVVKGLEAQVLRYTVGQKDEAYVECAAEYKAIVEAA